MEVHPDGTATTFYSPPALARSSGQSGRLAVWHEEREGKRRLARARALPNARCEGPRFPDAHLPSGRLLGKEAEMMEISPRSS
jgi:hypothetical protein